MDRPQFRPIKVSILKRGTDPAKPKVIFPEILEQRVVTSLNDLAALSTEGAPFSPSLFRDSYRNTSNFLACEFLALDYDSKGSIQGAIDAFKETGLQFIIGTTMSHGKAKGAAPSRDRFRVFIPITETIYDAALLQYNLEQVTLFTYPFYDLSTIKDCSRAYLPCVEIVHIQEEGGRPWEVLKILDYGSLATRPLNEFVVNTPGEGGGFNEALYLASKSFQGAGYEEDQCLEFMERFIFQPEFNPSGWDRITRQDEITIKSAFASAPSKTIKTRAEYLGKVPGAKGGKEEVDEVQETERIVTQEVPKHLALYRALEATHHFEILDFDNRLVRRVNNEEYLKELILKRILQKSSVLRADMPTATKIFTKWKELPGVITSEPEAIKQKEDTSAWAFAAVDVNFDPEGATPAWDEFLTRLSSPDDFLAWVWSCYEVQHCGRQVMWLYGPRGEDGKSAVLGVLSESMGNAACAIHKDNIKTNFGLAGLYGKRFAVYSDCMSAHFTQSERIRHLSSGDLQTVEFKGENAFSARIYLRIAVASNILPEINDIGAEKSRLMIIKVSATKNNSKTWVDQLRAEMPALLYRAFQAYRKKCPEHYNIELDPVTKDLVTSSAKIGSEYFETLIESNFIIDEGAALRGRDLQDFFRAERLSNPEQTRFREYLYKTLMENFGSSFEIKRRDASGNYYKGVRYVHGG